MYSIIHYKTENKIMLKKEKKLNIYLSDQKYLWATTVLTYQTK